MRVNGHKLSCGHCRGEAFSYRTALLNTTGMTMLNLDWLNKSADVFTCSDCGHLEWFVDAKITGDGDQSANDCPRCGVFVSSSVAVCPNCGEPR